MSTYTFKQYILPFEGFDGNSYEVQLWHHTDIYGAGENTVELDSIVSPIIIEYPEVGKCEPIHGSGCELNIMSNTNMQFLSLYTINIQEWEIRLVKNGSNVIWNGWLDTELYIEDYSEYSNYPIQFTGNDGFALLERFKFIDDNGDKFIGVKSQWEVINIILDKVGLGHNYIHVNLSTTFSNFSGATNSTILHETYVDCSNYYDEDGEAMTMREVLEGNLRPYGAYIQHIESNYYINDLHSLASADVTFKRFDFSTKAYISDINISNPVVDISTIKWASTGQRFEMVPGINRQLVTYSPYCIGVIAEDEINDIDQFSNVPSVWEDWSGYERKVISGNDNWTIYDEYSNFQVSRDLDFNEESNADVPYLQFGPQSDVLVASYEFNPYLVLSNVQWLPPYPEKPKGSAFLITVDAMAMTKSNPYDDTKKESVQLMDLKCKLSVGDYYATSENAATEWNTNSSNYITLRCYENGDYIDNKFVTNRDKFTYDEGTAIFVLGANLMGNFKFEIWSGIPYKVPETATIYGVWIRNINIKIVDIIGLKELGKDDVEIIGELDLRYKEEGQEVNLIHGTDSFLIDRGKLMYENGTFYREIDEWTRAGNTNKIEELLLNTIVSNHEKSTIKLSGTLHNTFTALQLITDTTNIPNVKFAVLGQSIDYYEGINEVVLAQVIPDNLTIIT